MVGDNAGPAKLAAIKKHGLKMMNEDEFLNLIAKRKGGQIDEKTRKKMEKEQEAIRQAAKEIEKREKEEAKREDKMEGPSGVGFVQTRFAAMSVSANNNLKAVQKLAICLHDFGRHDTHHSL